MKKILLLIVLAELAMFVFLVWIQRPNRKTLLFDTSKRSVLVILTSTLPALSLQIWDGPRTLSSLAPF